MFYCNSPLCFKQKLLELLLQCRRCVGSMLQAVHNTAENGKREEKKGKKEGMEKKEVFS